MEHLATDPSIQLGQALRVALECLHEAPVFSKSPEIWFVPIISLVFAPYFVYRPPLSRSISYFSSESSRTWFLRAQLQYLCLFGFTLNRDFYRRKCQNSRVFFSERYFSLFFCLFPSSERERELVRARAGWKGEWKLTGAQNEPYCARFLTYEGSPGERKCRDLHFYLKVENQNSCGHSGETQHHLWPFRFGVQSNKKFEI